MKKITYLLQKGFYPIVDAVTQRTIFLLNFPYCTTFMKNSIFANILLTLLKFRIIRKFSHIFFFFKKKVKSEIGWICIKLHIFNALSENLNFITMATLISLINVEPGINVEGCQKWKITKCGGGNKHQFLW